MAQEEDVPEIELEYAFSMRINNSGRIAFEGQMRSREFQPVSGGEIWGPRLRGRVVPQSGADYTGNGLMDTHIMLQAVDGTWLYMHQMGYEHTETEDGEPYFRVTPYFDAPAGSHDWLARTVLVGTGERHDNPNHSIIHYYALL